MNTTNMRHKNLTFDISGNRVRLKPVLGTLGWHELRIEGLADDTLVIRYFGEEMMNQDIEAYLRLFVRLSSLKPETWGNSKGVMSRGEIQLCG